MILACGPGTHRAEEVAIGTTSNQAMVRPSDGALWAYVQLPRTVDNGGADRAGAVGDDAGGVPPADVPAAPEAHAQSAEGAAGTGGLPGVQWRDIIARYDWPVDEALAVSWCESRHNPSAISADGANIGGFQINVIHAGKVGGDWTRLLDAETNVRIAYQIWADQGWAPWACRP